MSTQEKETIIDAILEATLTQQNQKGPDLRQLHAKSHGLVWGEFIVENNLPESLRVGVFKQAQSYPIWIRFSNAGGIEERGQLKSDREPDARGMSIKLMQVEGKKVVDDEETTQDFTLINSPIFFLHDLQGYGHLTKIQQGQADPSILQEEFGIIGKINAREVYSPLDIQYWSTTPYQFGDRAM